MINKAEYTHHLNDVYSTCQCKSNYCFSVYSGIKLTYQFCRFSLSKETDSVDMIYYFFYLKNTYNILSAILSQFLEVWAIALFVLQKFIT